MRRNLLSTAGPVVVVGALAFSTPAHAEWPTFDAITHTLITKMQGALTSAMDKVESRVKAIGDQVTGGVTKMDTDINDILTKGFTQQSNYQKGQVNAGLQIADASNAAMSRVNRDTRNAQIISEHVPNPQQCLSADGMTSSFAASAAAVSVAQSISLITDNRGEALAGQPAYYGKAQAVQAINDLHYKRYCSQIDDDAHLCSKSAIPNGDQHAWNLFGTGNLVDQDGVNAANDYATNLIQPVVPSALRADQLASITGQDGAARRRSYNSRISLARGFMNYLIGIQAPNVTLTANQKQQLQSENLPVVDNGSWMQAITLEVDRRFSGVSWSAALQQMPPATIEREVATELALSNYLALQNLRVGLWNTAVAATQVAQTEEAHFVDLTDMPSPDMAAK